MYSEKTPLLTPPSFYTRRDARVDLPGMRAFDGYQIRHSLLWSLETVPCRDPTIATSPGVGDDVALDVLVVSPDDALAKKQAVDNSPTAPATAHIFDGIDRSKTVSAARQFGGILGHGSIFPYRSPLEQRSAFDRTALICTFSLDQDLLGLKLWKAVTATLIDETLAQCRAKLKYKVVVADMSFREDQPSLVALRDMYLERGFEQVGHLKALSEKNGLLLDRAILQIML